ncbi:MAG: ubiquinone/menaquinone biosynthesis methyltransferase [Candidatus Omnitrophota bacterium]
MPTGSQADICGMFSFLARRYDLFNMLASLGMDRGWRGKVSGMVRDGSRVLDLCAGTGDLCLEIARKHKGCRIEALDFCPEMLEEGKRKALIQGAGRAINWTCGEACKMPYPDATFDIIVCGFALRNLSDELDGVFSECYRVLRDGGTLIALDLTRPVNPLAKFLYGVYLRAVIPAIGLTLYGKISPFRYLARSILDFYGPDEVKAKLAGAGFSECRYEPLAFGAAGIYSTARR